MIRFQPKVILDLLSNDPVTDSLGKCVNVLMSTRLFLMLNRCVIIPLMMVCGVVFAGDSQPSDSLDVLQKGRHVVLLRHALAPGYGDPEGFDLADCSTQRNLSDDGREQARRIGQLFRQAGYRELALYSSQWCRCRETAELMALGKVVELPFLNSFFSYREREQEQVAQTKGWLKEIFDEAAEDRVIVLVTHQVNITAMTGVFPRSGELVIAQLDKNGGLTVVSSVKTD